MEKLVDFALAYAELGWPVFPCHTPLTSSGWNCTCEIWKRKKISPEFECQHAGKHPRTKNGLDDATTDVAQIRDWWRKWPTANIGINCGKAGLLVVDLDTYRDNYQGDDLELDEETVTALSGGGGAHLFYRLEDGDPFGNSNKNLPNGIDIRGHGGYVIVAPSLHESGQQYQWENDYAPWDKPIAPIPPKLRALLGQQIERAQTQLVFDTTRKFDRNATRYGAKAIENQCALVATSANGKRNSTLNTAAFSLGRLVAGGEIDGDYAHNHLLTAARAVGLTDEEAERTIQSGFDAGAQQPFSTVADTEADDGFGEFPQELIGFFAKDHSNPVHVDEIQEVIAAMHADGKGIDEIRARLWRAMGNLGAGDRRLLSSYLHNLGLFQSKQQAGAFVDECAKAIDSIPLIERITDAISALGHTFRLNRLEDTIEADGGRLTDTFMSRLYLLMLDKKFNRQDVANAIDVMAERNSYHPVKDYLLGLEWDGADHLSAFLKCLGGDGAMVKYGDGIGRELNHVLVHRWLLGCVARALDGDQETAFKHQTPMLVLIGAQGQGKSSMVRWLCSGIGPAFHREGPIDPHSIDDKRSMVTKWIWEISELGSSLRKTDRDALKGIITQEWHTYRKPYGRYDITKPTLCNLVGTLNNETGFLDDPTGHRRFLPITLRSIDHAYSRVSIDQLWAQIVYMYLSGESPDLQPDEREALRQVHTQYEVENPLQTYLQMYFHIDPLDKTHRMHTAAIIERLRNFGIHLHNSPKIAGKEINDALGPMGLESSNLTIDGKTGRGWLGIRPNEKHVFWER